MLALQPPATPGPIDQATMAMIEKDRLLLWMPCHLVGQIVRESACFVFGDEVLLHRHCDPKTPGMQPLFGDGVFDDGFVQANAEWLCVIPLKWRDIWRDRRSAHRVRHRSHTRRRKPRRRPNHQQVTKTAWSDNSPDETSIRSKQKQLQAH